MLKKVRNIDITPFKFNIEKINPLFSRCKVYVMYHGKNRNLSSISKKAVENSLNTIFNIPIVGEFIEQDNGEGNFGGHGGKVEITDDDIKFIQTTKPIGVIPESADIHWEVIKDRKDIEREYLVVDGAYVWNRYYDEVSALKEDNFGQSMELEVFDGDWNDEEDVYDIRDFAFSALCILGIDKDGMGHVEPAFEDAKIITYSLDKDSFKEEFSQMLGELKFAMSKDNEKEDETLLKKLLEKYSLTVEELTDKGIKFDELTEEELEAKIVEAFKIESDEKDEKGEKGDEPGDSIEGEDNKDDLDPEGSKEEKEDQPSDEISEDFEKTIKDLRGEISDFESKIESLEKENKELKDYKANVEKESHQKEADELFAKFQLTEEDVKDLDIHSMSLETIEDKCFSIIGRKMATNSVNFSKDKIKINVSNKEVVDTPYGDIFERYNK